MTRPYFQTRLQCRSPAQAEDIDEPEAISADLRDTNMTGLETLLSDLDEPHAELESTKLQRMELDTAFKNDTAIG